MQVTLNIDPQACAITAQDLLAVLSPEDKRELAKEIIVRWLTSPRDYERRQYEQALLEKVKADIASLDEDKSGFGYRGVGHSGLSKYDLECLIRRPDEEIKSHSAFRAKVRDFHTAHDVVMADLAKAVKSQAVESIAELIKTDPQVQATKQAVLDHLRARFPSMVMQSMLNWFALNMNNIAERMLCTTMIQQPTSGNSGNSGNQSQQVWQPLVADVDYQKELMRGLGVPPEALQTQLVVPAPPPELPIVLGGGQS